MNPTTERALVSIYRSDRRREMYLYVPKKTGLELVPEALREHFGTPVPVMDLLLKRERNLARVDAGRVLDDLVEKGFYLQLPPGKESYLPNSRPDAVEPPEPGV